MIFGRDRELARICELLQELREERGGALLLRGEAGIGKTALLDAAGEHAAGVRLLECRGIQSESSLAFVALRDLVAPVVDLRAQLPAPQQAALEGALALGPPAPGDRLAVCVAMLGVLEVAARSGPVLALVDDLQWVDGPSRECVLYAARRVQGPIGVLLTARSGSGSRDDEWRDLPDVEVGPLHPTAATELLASATPDLAAGVRDAIAASAAGNPLALVELPATLTEEQLRGAAPLGRPLAPGRGLERIYAGRLERLSPGARAALLVAATSHTDELAPIAAACKSLESSAAALQEAEQTGLIGLSDTRVRFTHPLVRGAVYHAASPAERRSTHAALATEVDGEARAWHLAGAAVGPDEVAAAALEEAAGVAIGRRAYAAAADGLERAAGLSPDPSQSVMRLIGGAAAALSAGHATHATALAEEASARAGDPVARASAEHLLGVITAWGGRVEDALELLERSADVLTVVNPPMAAVVLSDAAFACSALGDCRRTLAIAERAAGLLGETASPAERAPVLAILSWALVLRGQTVRARPIIDEARRLAAALDPSSPAAQVVSISINCRLPSEDYEGALADNLAQAAVAEEAGALYGLPNPLCVAAMAAFRLGRWDGLADLCTRAIQAAEDCHQWGPAALGAVTRARLAAAQGDDALGRADAEAPLALAESGGARSFCTYGHGALGFLELSAGRVDAAILELEQAEHHAEQSGLEEPTLIPWAPDLVEAYVRAGREDGARRVLATLVRQAELADTAGAAALAARCQGLVAQADFDEHFARAMTHHDGSPMPFERARTLLAWGMRLHRARRRVEAREKLRAAAELFEELGARPWAELARAEQRAAGGRRRQELGDALSTQEQRVAQAAAGGATTREIAAELFLSPKTVEFHLGHAYRKLGIRSRAALAGALADREQGAGTPS